MILIQTAPELDIVAADPAIGAITTLIAGPTSPDFRPTFSPDGRRFLFGRDKGLFVANSDGSGVRELIAGGSCGSPLIADWLPDSDRLRLNGRLCRHEQELYDYVVARGEDGSVVGKPNGDY